MYWATAERTNSASGEAVSRNRERDRVVVWARGCAPVGTAVYSKRSGSVRQISCQSGWKLNQPASGKPVCGAVYEANS